MYSSDASLNLYLGNTLGPGVEEYQWRVPSLIEQHGRFWFKNGIVYYRTPQGHDLFVNKLEIGRSTQGDVIARLNGRTVSLVALEQLRVLIERYGKSTVYSELASKIERYRSEINQIVEHMSNLTGKP